VAWEAIVTTDSRSGLSVTAPMGVQSRVQPTTTAAAAPVAVCKASRDGRAEVAQILQASVAAITAVPPLGHAVAIQKPPTSATVVAERTKVAATMLRKH